MSDRVRIYHRSGVGLADLRVTAERTAFVDDEGEAEFDIVTNDPNCREDYLSPDNWLLIENDKLEPWVGMIDEPQEWKRRYVHVHAFTPDKIFYYVNVPRELRIGGKSGNIYKECLNLMNRVEPSIIQAGDIWTGGTDFGAENMSGNNLQDYIFDLMKRAGAEFSFTPVPFQGRLTIQANWHKRMGIESNFPLEESYNLADENNSLRVHGPVYNELWGYGNGAGQTDRATAVFTAPGERSRRLRQGTKTYSDYMDDGAVLNAIRNEINATKDPTRTFKLSATDTGATWNNIRLGNIHPLRMWSVGFGINTHIRVMGYYFNPFRGKVELINNEVINVSAA